MASQGGKSAPLSARGVAGEANSDGALKKLVGEHGSHVPYFTLYGEQHHRLPLKDKAHFAGVKPYPEWNKVAKDSTQSEMQAHRRRDNRPDLSFDLDGDGVVGQRDFFLSKLFSKEHDNRLNAAERKQALEAMKSADWMNQFSFGHEQAGARRPYPVVQKRGKIITVNNVGDLKEVYPPHWNAHKVPAHATATDMHAHRRAEVGALENAILEEHCRQNPFMVPEPYYQPEGFVEKPQVTKIKDVEQQRRTEARLKAGLLPEATVPNTDRDGLQLGLGYNEQPAVSTKTALEKNRKERQLQDLHDSQQMALDTTLPRRVRQTMREHDQYEQRRTHPDTMTLSKLKHNRKVDFIEHNLATCSRFQKDLPRFSEQDSPWWTLQEGYVSEPASSKVMKEDLPLQLTGKVTEAQLMVSPRSHPEEPIVPVRPPPPKDGMPLSYDAVSGRAQQRWTSEFTPPGMKAMEPRHFDGIKQAHTLFEDTEPLYKFSSFAVIREAAAKKDAERQQEVARQDERRAQALKFNSATRQRKQHADDASGDGEAVFHAQPTSATGEVDALAKASVSEGSVGAADKDVGAPPGPGPEELHVHHPVVKGLAPAVLITPALAQPSGENAAMMDRLLAPPPKPPFSTGWRMGATLSARTTTRATASPITPSPRADKRRSRGVDELLAGPVLSSRDGGGGLGAELQQQRLGSSRAPSKAAAAAVPAAAVPAGPQFSVRTSGFQWVDRPRRAMTEDSSRSTLVSKMPTGHDPRHLKHAEARGETNQASLV